MVDVEDYINISIQRDAARYVHMLLGDQLVDIAGNAINQHIEIIRDAYQHVKTEIEQSLERT